MKNLNRYRSFYVIIFLISCALYACENPDDTAVIPVDKSSVAKTEGGRVSLLNGDIIMEIPAGAVSAEIAFSVSECDLSDCSNLLIRPLEITPKITFQKPVLLKIRFDCAFSNGNPNVSSLNIFGCHWNSEHHLLLNKEFLPLSCEIDRETKTLNMYINKTGVFAFKCSNQ